MKEREGLLQVLQFGEFVQNRGKCIEGQFIGRQNSGHGHETLCISNRTLIKLWAIFCSIVQTLTDPTWADLRCENLKWTVFTDLLVPNLSVPCRNYASKSKEMPLQLRNSRFLPHMSRMSKICLALNHCAIVSITSLFSVVHIHN